MSSDFSISNEPQNFNFLSVSSQISAFIYEMKKTYMKKMHHYYQSFSDNSRSSVVLM